MSRAPLQARAQHRPDTEPATRRPDRIADARNEDQTTTEDAWSELAQILLRMLEAPIPPETAFLANPERTDTARDPAAGPAAMPEPGAQTATDDSADNPLGLPRTAAAMPAGEEVDLLQGRVPGLPTGPVDMPAFPQGDQPLPDATAPEAAPVTGSSAGAPATLPPSGGDSGAGARQIVQRWQGQVSAAASGLPEPNVEVPPEGRSALRRASGGARTRNETARDGLTQDAINTVPAAPELDTTPPAPPPPNPVPEHTAAVLAASGKRLPDQSAPVLVNSERRDVEGQIIGGTAPPLGVEPVADDLFQVLITPGARDLAALPGAAAPGVAETTEQRRVRLALETLTATPDTDDRQGRGPQVISPDLGPLRPAPLSASNRAHVGELVTRLLANPGGTAGQMMDDLRRNAFADGVLLRNFPTIGQDMSADLQTALISELREMADAAGIAGDELDRMVSERQEQLRRSAEEAEELATEEGDTATEEVTDEGQRTADAIEGAADAAEEETLNRQAAVAGEADPEVVNGRRDRIVAWFREHVTTEITTYQRAYDRRERELNKARDDQLSGYRTLTQREVYQVMSPAAPRPERNTSDAARERRLADVSVLMNAWRDARIAAVREHFRLALASADITTRTNRTTIQDAGSAGIEAARQWAEDKILSNKSWWDRFVARLTRWLGEARNVNEEWRVRRGTENRDAIATDMDAVQLAFDMVRDGVDLNAEMQSDRLTDAQKEAITAYFRMPRGTHPLDFAETRLRRNLTRDHQPGANAIFERELIATPVGAGDHGTANKLNDVARAQSGSFNAASIAQNVHAAMDQVGTDERRIFDNLRGLTALQGAVVRKMYMAMFHRSLDADLEDEMSGDELEQAQAQIEGQQSRADAIALHDAMSGPGTDEAAIMRLLRNKTPAEAEAIRAEYLRMYGRTLDADLKDDLSEGNEIDQAQALISGDTATADAIALDEAMRGGFLGLGTSEEDITEVQSRVRSEVLARARAENWTPQQMEAEVRRRLGAIEGRFEDRYSGVEQYNEPGLGGGTTLRRAFRSELSGAQLDYADALQDNDMIRADAAQIEIERTSLFYASDEKINEVLRSQYERALEGRRLAEGPARNMRVSRLVSDLRAQQPPLSEEEISRRRMALERQMERELEDGAQRDSEVSMQELGRIYENKYFWPLSFVVETNMTGEDRNKARNMLDQGGRLDPLQEVEYATRTEGTDEDTLRRVLGRMTHAELRAMAAEWERRHPGRRFRDMLVGELSGRDSSDILDMYDYGAPESSLEAIAREERRVERETRDLTGVLGGAAAGREAEWMNSELSRLQDLRTDLNRTDWPDTPEGRADRARLAGEVDFRVSRVEAAVEDHRRRIDSVTDTATQVVGIVVAVVVGAIVTVATAGTAAPAVIAAWAAVSASLAATAATMATKALIKGGAYGIEEVGIDIAVGVVDAVAAYFTAGLGSRLIEPLKGVARGTRLPALAARLGRTGMAQRLAQAEGGGVLARIGRSVVPTREGAERAVANFIAEGIGDAAGSLPSALVQTAAADQTWQGDPLKNFLEGGGMAIVQSVAMGRTLGAGMSLAGSAFHLGRGIWREGGDMGRLLELNRLVNDSYGTYRHDNPHASLGDFLASPHGRSLQFEIEQRGLMSAMRDASQLADQMAPPPAVRADADVTAAATGRNAPSPDAVPPRVMPDEARVQMLHNVLPPKLREGSFVTPDPDLTGRTVRVEPLRIGKQIIGVDIRIGPDATPLDIAMHMATVDAMIKYRGLLGDIRRAWHDMLAQLSGSGMTIGSRGWEAQLELEKLPGLVFERMEAMTGAGLSPQAQARMMSDFVALETQFHQHEVILSDPVARAEPGRGFVAGESGPMRRRRADEGLDGLSILDEADMTLARTEGDDLAVTPRGPQAIRPPTAAELSQIDIGERLSGDTRLLTEAGRVDLARRLDAARRHLDGMADGDPVPPQVLLIIEQTARLFDLDQRLLVSHITADGGDPRIHDLLRRPDLAIEPSPAPAPDPVGNKDFLTSVLNAMPREDGAAVSRSMDEIFAGIRSGDPSAQAQLDALSAAPRDYELQNVSWDQLEAMLRGNRIARPDVVNPDTGTLRVGEGTIIVDGRRLDSGARATDEAGNRLFTFRHDFPPYAKAGRVVLQLADGRMRVWRLPDDTLVLETVAAPGVRRQHHERSQLTHTEAKMEGPFTELAHALGAGLGAESAFGIRRALVYVNQELQGRGIEKYIAALRDNAPPGVSFAYRIEIGTQATQNRLAAATYAVDAIINGERVPFLEFGIRTAPLPADVEPGSVAASRLITIDPVEPAAVAMLRPEMRQFLDVIRNIVPPPDSITRRDLLPSATLTQRQTALREASPEQVRNAAARDPRLQLVEVPPVGSYDQTEFLREVQSAIFRRDHKEVVIVDLRDTQLSTAQIAALRAALMPLVFIRSGADLVLVEDIPAAAP
ncbi:hypothetical protein JJJ17_11145 [Paracoccus caeni]|uniref:Annexin n=1 Tax=Paracoccus caeni TaxID=657651 RepID=A0A934VYY3_9RHOB|nr:hypothetical protein [Paracoccus caeni]MBK4216482.1 hypothetical protein [Paracoccus caeni]